MKNIKIILQKLTKVFKKTYSYTELSYLLIIISGFMAVLLSVYTTTQLTGEPVLVYAKSTTTEIYSDTPLSDTISDQLEGISYVNASYANVSLQTTTEATYDKLNESALAAQEAIAKEIETAKIEEDRIQEAREKERRKREKRKNQFNISKKDISILYRIVEAEATNEDEYGKFLVANVVLNRVISKKFPDTVEDVVFQVTNGTYQFSPILDGRYYSVNITKETKKAVQRALNGEDTTKGALYFMSRRQADSDNVTWFDRELTWLFEYGTHEFFR